MKRCDFCGGRFGLIRHGHFGKRFCCKRCKQDYVAGRVQKIQSKLLAWAPGRLRMRRAEACRAGV
jgi:hypothetical protein